MSSSSKPKPVCFGSDIRRLLLAAEAGHKADILTYSSGHLGPHSLDQGQPHMATKQSFWKMSQSQEATPKPLTLQQRRAKALTCVKKKAIKESPPEFTASAALVESEVSESREDQATDNSSHADTKEDISPPKIVHCSSNSLPFQPRAFSQKRNPSSELEGNQFFSSHSDQEGVNTEDQLKRNQWLGRQFTAKQDLWAGINVAEKHERKLQKELRKLSVQSWPSRDRLAVFSDVFDDVCESSPVFGRILREIKTDYDLYVNHMMASHSPLHDMSLNPSLEDLSSGKMREMVQDAEEEVCRLEVEARRALKENERVRNELQNVPAITGPEDSDMKNISLSGLQDTGHADSVQFKRLQVLNMWQEIQQLEEEIKEKLVSTVTTTATERRIKDLKGETVRLIALNERLKTTNKNLENKINMVLNREKLSKTVRRRSSSASPRLPAP
ncbi:group XIIB secretory phospholipase A2-like protein isoform X2 [Trachinotus anak]|uniref:group XIIB secretory phospholipase A2-like protein isoform X2 n=1 Tax=Trachinotus anak TaxID=443729 RepID=UPI0039F23B17